MNTLFIGCIHNLQTASEAFKAGHGFQEFSSWFAAGWLVVFWYLFVVLPCFCGGWVLFTETALLTKLKDNDFLNYGTAAVKYKEFVARYPDLALQVLNNTSRPTSK